MYRSIDYLLDKSRFPSTKGGLPVLFSTMFMYQSFKISEILISSIISLFDSSRIILFVCFSEEAVIRALGAPLQALENSWVKTPGGQKRNKSPWAELSQNLQFL